MIKADAATLGAVREDCPFCHTVSKMATETKQSIVPELAAEVHITNEALLREAADYLLRLPYHPMTVTLAKKIQSQLDDPRSRIVLEDDKRQAEARRTDLFSRRGSSRFTPAGLPVILVTVEGETARVSSPAAKSLGSRLQGDKFAAHLVEELANGVLVQLSPRRTDPPSVTARSELVDQKASLMKLLSRLLEQSGDEEVLSEMSVWMDEWLVAPLRDLGGVTPSQAMRNDAGRRQVEDLLVRMHGGH